MITLAIDPGYAGTGCACATFNDDRLEAVWFERVATFGMRDTLSVSVQSRTQYSNAEPVDFIVIERPQQDERSRVVPPQVLMALAWHGALLAGAFAGRDGAPIIEYTPNDWKGSEPKPVMHARLWKLLTTAERAILGGAETHAAIMAAREKGALDRWGKPGVAYYQKKFTTHNLLDAACLGAVHVGRLQKAGT